MPASDRPTAADIDDFQHHFTGVWRETERAAAKRDQFYERKYPVWPTEEMQNLRASYRPSTPTYVIDHAADTQMAFLATVRRDPWRQGPQHKVHADQAREALQVILDNSSMREMQIPWKAAGKFLLHQGYSVLEAPKIDLNDQPEEPVRESYDKDDDWKAKLAIYEYRKRNWNPMRIKAPHPMRVLLDPSEKTPRHALSKEKWFVRDVRRWVEKKRTEQHRFDIIDQDVLDQILADTGKKLTDTIDVTPFWTNDWHTVKLNGSSVLYSEVNTGGFVPYLHSFAGFGMEPTDFSSADPSHFAAGLLDPIMESITRQAQGSSAKHELLIQYTYAKILFSGDPAELARQMANEILQVDPQEIARMPTQELAQWIFNVGEEHDRDIELGSYSRTAGGFREPGVNTVGQQAILSGSTHQKFAGPGMQLQAMGTLIGERIYQWVDATGLEIGINGKMLNRTNIEHDYHCEVTFEVRDPVLDFQTRQQGRQDWMNGAISTQTYREDYLRVSDVRERRRRLREQVSESSAVVGRLAEAATKEEGLDELDEFLVQDIQGELTGAEEPPSSSPSSGPIARLRNVVGRAFRPSGSGQDLAR